MNQRRTPTYDQCIFYAATKAVINLNYFARELCKKEKAALSRFLLLLLVASTGIEPVSKV
jgi:hypothetical protein